MFWVGATLGSGGGVMSRICLQPFTPFGCHGDTARGLHFLGNVPEGRSKGILQCISVSSMDVGLY